MHKILVILVPGGTNWTWRALVKLGFTVGFILGNTGAFSIIISDSLMPATEKDSQLQKSEDMLIFATKYVINDVISHDVSTMHNSLRAMMQEARNN